MGKFIKPTKPYTPSLLTQILHKATATKLVTARLLRVSLTDTSRRKQNLINIRLYSTEERSCDRSSFVSCFAQNSLDLWNFYGTFHTLKRAKWKLKWNLNWKLSAVALLYQKSPFLRIGFFRCLRNCCGRNQKCPFLNGNTFLSYSLSPRIMHAKTTLMIGLMIGQR